MKAALARKIGMTQVYNADGKAVPATLLDLADARVVRKLADVNKIEIGIGSKKRANKAEKGIYGDVVPAFKQVVEADNLEVELSAAVKADIFVEGEKVHVTGTTKGKGFQGVVKRHGFKGGPNTHGGQSGKLRSPGSIGPGTSHGRVFKGKQMAGHMGQITHTTRSLKVVAVNPELNVIAVTGSVPGSNGSYVLVRKA
jgi:large subunit ribosomal protein L3